jgi:peptide/nickel transport system permease protein
VTATWRAALRRLGWALAMVVGVVTIAFVVARALPGDPARLMLGPQAPPADVDRARRIYRLDAPLAVQYVTFWRRLVHLGGDEPPAEHASCGSVGRLHVDLGYSYRYKKRVVEVLWLKAPRSLELALGALLVQMVLGLGLGALAARYRGRPWEQLATGVTLIGISAPTFVLGLLLQYLFAHRLGWLPHDGYGETRAEQLTSLVLPALTLGLYGAALYARLTRDELATALAQDYVRTARAKGASQVRATVVHALRAALVPIATLLVLDLGTLVGGAVVTERLFRWPGMGSMAVDALVHRDGPVIVGTVVVSSVAVVIASVAVDLLALSLDPRLRRRAG